MEKRMIDFIDALRASGVRVSVAESADAFAAVQYLGIKDPRAFQSVLCATLVKDSQNLSIFDRLFPLYFGSGGPPLLNTLDSLTPEEKQGLADALRNLLEQHDQEEYSPNQPQSDQHNSPAPHSPSANLLNLLQMLLSGENPTSAQMDQMGQRVGLQHAHHPYQQRWMEQRMQKQFKMGKLDPLLEQLWEMLAEAGMSQETIAELQEIVEGNREALSEQIGQYVGSRITKQSAKEKRASINDSLMNRPFEALNEQERENLRHEIRRLAAQLRSKAALRQKRSKTGVLDVRRTLRANMRYDSVPFSLQFKSKRLKPKLVLICDVSTSMRPVVEFMLSMIYELQDQVAKARSFAFIDDTEEVSDEFSTYPAGEALDIILERMKPGYYNTDLGYSLLSFTRKHLDAIDHRTTVIVVGDARNNYNDPCLGCMDQIKRRAKRIIWLNPENPQIWGSGDSDMPAYLPYCDIVHKVANMVELTSAVDRLLVP